MGHGRFPYLVVGSCSFLLTDFPPLNRPKKLALYVVCSEGEQKEGMGLLRTRPCAMVDAFLF
jgi:hypothetical protein